MFMLLLFFFYMNTARGKLTALMELKQDDLTLNQLLVIMSTLVVSWSSIRKKTGYILFGPSNALRWRFLKI